MIQDRYTSSECHCGIPIRAIIHIYPWSLCLCVRCPCCATLFCRFAYVKWHIYSIIISVPLFPAFSGLFVSNLHCCAYLTRIGTIMYYFNYSLIGKCVISCALVMRLKDQRRSHTEGVFINALSTIVCFLPTPCLAFICPLLTLLTLYRFSYNKILIWRSPTVGRIGVFYCSCWANSFSVLKFRRNISISDFSDNSF